MVANLATLTAPSNGVLCHAMIHRPERILSVEELTFSPESPLPRSSVWLPLCAFALNSVLTLRKPNG
jgi:hypothetical protein